MTLAGQTRKPVIKAALAKLRASFDGDLTPSVVAKSEKEMIAVTINTVHYNNQKAKRLHEGAKILMREYRGVVPDSQQEIQRLPGMGPQLARVTAAIISVVESGAEVDPR